MESNKAYQQRFSETIKWLRFPLIFFIIMLHCYSVVKLNGEHEVYFKTLYPFALWLGETGVPGFFFISGYLFFLSKKSYTEKIKNRIHTLLIPYIIWNSVMLLLYILSYSVGFPQEINNRSLTDFSALDYLRLYWDRGEYDNGNFVPLLCPLWYIRNLMIMSILSPLLFYIIKYARELFIIITGIWWLQSYHNAFIQQTIFFFSLGAYFSIHGKNPLSILLNNRYLPLILFAAFAICDIIFHITPFSYYNLQIHRISLALNIFALIILSDYLIKRGIKNEFLPRTVFIVFCIHYPIVVALRKICIWMFVDVPETVHIALFFLCALLTTFITLVVYQIISKYCPKVKKILSGNR